jgi:nucleoside-diphosphate-sugar epimerase
VKRSRNNARCVSISNSKIFITGGAGFIGTRLARELAAENEVVLFDNLHNDAYTTSQLQEFANVRLVRGDVRDADSVRRAMDSDVDYVIHAAAIAGVNTVLADPVRVLEVNIQGTFNVVGAALKLPHLKRLVDFSTSEVFGSIAENVDESEMNLTVSVTEPRWVYALSKLTGEFLVHAHHVRDGLPSVTIRPFNIYGPNQVGVGAIHHFVRRALAGEDLVIHGDGSQIRAWCYIDDFIDGILRAMDSEKSIGRSYNIGNPRSTVTVSELARMIVDLAGSASRIIFEPMSGAEVFIRIPNITAAREDLGFVPEVDLAEGLKRTIEWYRSAE